MSDLTANWITGFLIGSSIGLLGGVILTCSICIFYFIRQNKILGESNKKRRKLIDRIDALHDTCQNYLNLGLICEAEEYRKEAAKLIASLDEMDKQNDN